MAGSDLISVPIANRRWLPKDIAIAGVESIAQTIVYFPVWFHEWASGGRVSGKRRTVFALAG